MILSAGFGTRLRPLTDNTPKALVLYKNKTLIEHQLERLKYAGITEIIINAHHLADKMVEYFKLNDFGLKIEILKEDEILGTGGGILNANPFLKDEECFLVINVDVDTDISLSEIIEHHYKINPFATLAIQKRITKRYLEFDSQLNFIGRAGENTSIEDRYAFNGIHVISGEIFNQNFEVRYRDIIDLYLELLMKGEKIKGYDIKNFRFKDIGKIENLE